VGTDLPNAPPSPSWIERVVAVRVSAVVSLDSESAAERFRTLEEAETTVAEFGGRRSESRRE
jgi:hypothetical protein